MTFILNSARLLPSAANNRLEKSIG
jgi:hypothetical protein